MTQRLWTTTRTAYRTLDDFAYCKTAADLWNRRDAAQDVINSIAPYLKVVQLLAGGQCIADEYRIGIAVYREGQEIGRYMSRNDPETGKIRTIVDHFVDDEPHIAFIMQERDVLQLVQERDRIARLGYVPLLGYLPKIQPLAGYRDLFGEAVRMVPGLLRGK